MALDQTIIDLVRDEIGMDPDFVDNITDMPSPGDDDYGVVLDSIENIYLDRHRGNKNVLRTALVCWRRRKASYESRGFDISTAGTLLSRRQRIASMERIIKNLEMLVETTHRAKNVRGRVGSEREHAEFS